MVEQLKLLERALTNRHFIHEKFKSRLKSEHACYHQVPKLQFAIQKC